MEEGGDTEREGVSGKDNKTKEGVWEGEGSKKVDEGGEGESLKARQ